MSNATMAALGVRVREILKALSPDKADDAPVPNPPPDPDALPTDPRVAGADASPKKKDLEEAGESQAAAAPAPGEEAGSEASNEDDDPDKDKDKDKDGRPVTKSFDEFGDADLDEAETRELLKAYGVTPPTDEDKLTHGGADVEAILEAILQGLESQNAAMSALMKEVAQLRSSNSENERSIAKALCSIADPRTAPAAPPRAITKALVDESTFGTGETEAQFSTRIFTAVKAGRMSQSDALAETRAFKTR